MAKQLPVEIRKRVREIVVSVRMFILRKVYKVDVHPTAFLSFGFKVDKANPDGVHIGAETYVASGAIILAHDFVHRRHADTYIGEKCFIGSNSMIMPGLRIGNQVIVGGGSIVTHDVPDNCIVAGNPAKVIKTGIHTLKYGRLDN